MSETWEIINLNGDRWGGDTYPTREAAERDLREFFRGVAVKFDRFTIRPVEAPALSEHPE